MQWPPDCKVEVDSITEIDWNAQLSLFADANLYQTWAHESTRTSRGVASRLVLRCKGDVIAAAQVRIVKLPLARAGVAYVRWGPMWRRNGAERDVRNLALVLIALREEYVVRRGLLLRILPYLFEDERDLAEGVLEAATFERVASERPQRTLVMNLDRPLAELRTGLDQKWRNGLNRAERNGLELEEGDDDAFASFVSIYQDMHARKGFEGASDIAHFQRVQRQLPGALKMRVAIARHEGKVAAGVVVSLLGDTGVFLLGATADAGMQSKASYLLQWRALQWLHGSGAKFYNLHGINPNTNPGTYHFKAGLCGKNGRDVSYLGTYDCAGAGTARIVQMAGVGLRKLRQGLKSMRSTGAVRA